MYLSSVIIVFPSNSFTLPFPTVGYVMLCYTVNNTVQHIKPQLKLKSAVTFVIVSLLKQRKRASSIVVKKNHYILFYRTCNDV